MSVAVSLSLLLLFSVLGLLTGVVRRVGIWRKGRAPAEPPKWRALLTIPKRYFVDLHHIVQRDEKAARMHISFAGGLVALLLLFFAVWLFSYGVILNILLILAMLLFVVGTVLLFLRRQHKPPHLSYGSYHFSGIAACLLLFAMVLLLATEYTITATVIALPALAWFFFSGVFDQPLKHIISGALHLAFHPREWRFSDALTTGLLASENNKNYIGANLIEDFSWRQVLGFDACIECGRCQTVCPAFASGQPLNPKKLIQDLYLLSVNQNDTRYSGSHHPNKSAKSTPVNTQKTTIAERIDADTLYACTTCRACVEACPMMIEHLDAIIDIRRYQTMSLARLPEKATEALTNLRHTDTVGGYNNAERHQWASGLNIAYAQPDKKYDVLLLCGEAAFNLRSQKMLRDLVAVVQQAGIRIAVLEDEADSGDVARRLGDETLYQQLATKMMRHLDQLDFKQIVTPDPHIYHIIKNEYPQLGGCYSIQHASHYLYDLIIEQKKLKTTHLNQRLTYHDPCYLGRYNRVIDEPRALLKHIGVEVIEMQKSKTQARCCGWGGGSAFSDIAGKKRIPDMRMDDVRQCGDIDAVAVNCPNCMTMLEGVVAPRAEVVDVISLVAQAVKEGAYNG